MRYYVFAVLLFAGPAFAQTPVVTPEEANQMQTEHKQAAELGRQIQKKCRDEAVKTKLKSPVDVIEKQKAAYDACMEKHKKALK